MSARPAGAGPGQVPDPLEVSTRLAGLAGVIGQEYFDALVATLARLTGADYALIARRVPGQPELAETLAMHALSASAPPQRFALAGTPCEHTLAGETCRFTRGVAQAFPRDERLAQMGVEAYVAIPLCDPRDQPIGFLAVLHRQPREDADAVVATLSSFSARTASEIERTLQEERLRRHDERLTAQSAALVELARSPTLQQGDLDGFLREITESIARTLGLERALVGLFDRELKVLRVADLYQTASGSHSSGEVIRIDDCPTYLAALEAGRFLSLADALADPRTQELQTRYYEPTGVRSSLDAPIRIGGRLIGVICSESISAQRRWHREEEQFAASVADLVSLGLEAMDLRAAQREVRSRNRALSALQSISDISLRARTLEAALHETVAEVAELSGFPAVWLRLTSKQDASSRFVAGHGLFEQDARPRVDVESFPSQEVIAADGLVVGPAAPAPGQAAAGLFVGLPLLREQRVLGALYLWDPEGREADDELVGLLRGLASAIAGLVERAQAREQSEALEERLRQSQKLEAIGTLAGGVAHDFNNLLTGILGYTWLLRQNAEPEGDVYRAALVIENAAERAAELTRQLLGFARQGKHEEVSVDITHLVRDVTELVGHTIDKSVVVHSQAQDGELRLLGDPGQLHQVLLNLAINARDAMPRGGDLYFESRVVAGSAVPRAAHPQLGPGAHAVIEVRDTGSGISPANQRRVFEPFFTTKEQGKGSGMGLAMVYGIVQGHRGAIEVESVEDQGTTFRIWLPVTESAWPTERSLGSARGAQQVEEYPRGEGLVLVVDDELIVREMAAQLLSGLGYEVIEARNGLEAIDCFLKRRAEIRLVLLDMVMPRMGGRECLRALKRVDPDVRVLISSGWQRDGLVQGALDDGALGFLAKPYQLSTLSQAVARSLQD